MTAMDRRVFLGRLGRGVAAAWPWTTSAQSGGFPADVELELRAAPSTAALRPGAPTRVWQYSGRVLRGPQTALQAIPGSYLGPVLRVRTGQRIRVHFANDLPEKTIVHWHGLDVPAAMDGHPRLAIESGRRYTYEFQVTNRAGAYWYHPHPHMRTAPQVIRGLAGLMLVSDPEEAALAPPSGDGEILCVLQDRQFDSGNQFVYLSGMPMDQMTGFLGDRVLVNGRSPEALSLATRPYRVRLMNGSNSRIYKLAWDGGGPITVIGTDGGLLERPVVRPYVTLAPGERVDTILDLRERPVGSRLTLKSLAFSLGGAMGRGAGRGMGRGAMGRGGGMRSLPNGAPIDILSVAVDRRERSTFALPARLSTFSPAWLPPPGVPTRTVRIDFRMMRFLLNGREFDMQDVAPDETVTAGSTHIWEFDNSGPAAMMNMRFAHPMHLHGRQFRVLRRQTDPDGDADWQTVADGVVDEGWKDTVLVAPGQRVQALVQFSRHPGLYLYHCHNLEHEDMGMMRNYRIV